MSFGFNQVKFFSSNRLNLSLAHKFPLGGPTSLGVADLVGSCCHLNGAIRELCIATETKYFFDLALQTISEETKNCYNQTT